MESMIPKFLKKANVGLTETHCVLCKNHGGAYTMDNTCDCHQYNRDGTPINRSSSTSKPQSKERGTKGTIFHR